GGGGDADFAGEELKADNDDFGGSNDFAGGDDFPGGDNEFGAPQGQSSDNDFFQQDSSEQTNDFGDNDGGFGDGFGDDMGGDMPPPPPENVDPYGALAEVDNTMDSDSTALREWRAARDECLAEVDAKSAEKEEEMSNKAKEDLEAFYNNYDEQKSKSAATNREAENDFLQARDSKPTDKDWETVCELVDFNPKTQRSAKDTGRMRQILLQLKQTPLVR
ncbi:hypothetical protein SARC_05360, partial [Sphaeroforma arctica JP610]